MISIISITYNGIGVTSKMIDSILKYLSIPFELIIIDNCSVENEAHCLSEKYGSQITTIRSECNLGFAGGNNLGIHRAKGDYILLLNNDTEVTDDSIKYLAEYLEKHPECGAVSPKIIFYDNGKIQYAGYSAISAITIRNATIGLGEEDRGQYDIASETNCAHGAAMMLPRSVIDKVGMMSEIFFLYYEEVDWCEHIKRAGYTIGYEPKCRILHKESSSIGENSPMKCYYLMRNRLLFAYRNRTGVKKILSILYQLSVVVTKDCLKKLLKGEGKQALAVVKGAWDFIFFSNKNQ